MMTPLEKEFVEATAKDLESISKLLHAQREKLMFLPLDKDSGTQLIFDTICGQNNLIGAILININLRLRAHFTIV